MKCAWISENRLTDILRDEKHGMTFMKLPAICALALSATVVASQAGSFGGPPPFSNLSPLQSGIDGSYQAVCRGENTTGVIRFSYSGGNQTSNPAQNSYTFFVNGKQVVGATTVAINNKDIDGILEGSNLEVPTNDDGEVQLPIIFIISGSRASGFFTGHIDLENRVSAFQGDGTIGPAASETNTVIFIPDLSDFDFIGIGTNSNIIFTTSFVLPGSDIDEIQFTFNGIRTSTIAGAGTTSAALTPTANGAQ
jgi:hypothetical protein